MIELKLRPTNFMTNWECHICGGWTNNDAVLCECSVDGEDVRACSDCLKDPEQVDEKLESHAQAIEGYASYIRSLKGNLRLPTYDQWLRATADLKAEQAAEDAEFSAELAD